MAIAEADCWLDPEGAVGIETIIDVAGDVRICLGGRSGERDIRSLRCVTGCGWLCGVVEQIELHKQVGGKLIKNIRPVYANKSSFVDLRPVERVILHNTRGRCKGAPRGLVSAKNAELKSAELRSRHP